MLKSGEKGAVLQRDNQTYAIVPHTSLGVISVEFLEKLVKVAKEFNVQAIKLTSSNRIAIVGLREKDIDKVWEILGVPPGAAVGLCIRSVKVCPGKAFCKLGQQDTLSLGAELDKKFHGLSMPAKFKIGVSGCVNDCAEVCIKDLGFIGKPKGWTLMVGGTGGAKPMLSKKLAENLSTEEALIAAEKLINFYKENGKKGERFGRFIERIGIEEVRKII